MAIRTLHFWTLSRDPKGVPQYEYLVAIFIPIWFGLAYMAMALGQGKVEAAGQIAHLDPQCPDRRKVVFTIANTS